MDGRRWSGRDVSARRDGRAADEPPPRGDGRIDRRDGSVFGTIELAESDARRVIARTASLPSMSPMYAFTGVTVVAFTSTARAEEDDRSGIVATVDRSSARRDGVDDDDDDGDDDVFSAVASRRGAARAFAAARRVRASRARLAGAGARGAARRLVVEAIVPSSRGCGAVFERARRFIPSSCC